MVKTRKRKWEIDIVNETLLVYGLRGIIVRATKGQTGRRGTESCSVCLPKWPLGTV